MNVLGTITLDMQRPGYAVIYAVQFDKLTRQITAQLTDKGLPWTVPTGALMTIRYSKPDGTQGFYDTLEDGTTAYTISGSAVTFTLAQQALAAAGNVLMQLNFYTAGGEALSSFSFIVTVQPSVLNDAEVVSSDYYNVLTGLLTQFAEQIEDLDNALRAGYGAPLKAATVSAMTDHAKIYVYTGSETGYTAGHWYYYNGTAWTDGGVYNAVAVNTDTTLTLAGVPADAKATGDAVSSLKSDLGISYIPLTSKNYFEQGSWVSNEKNIDAKRIRTKERITVKEGDILYINGSTLYFAATEFEDTEATTPLQSSGWVLGTHYLWYIEQDGVVTLNIANGEDYNSSTNIVPNDFNGTLAFLQKDYLNAIFNLYPSDVRDIGTDYMVHYIDWTAKATWEVGSIYQNGSPYDANKSAIRTPNNAKIALKAGMVVRTNNSAIKTLFGFQYNKTGGGFVGRIGESGVKEITIPADGMYKFVLSLNDSTIDVTSETISVYSAGFSILGKALDNINQEIEEIHSDITELEPKTYTYHNQGEKVITKKQGMNIVSAGFSLPDPSEYNKSARQDFDIYNGILFQLMSDNYVVLVDITDGSVVGNYAIDSGHGNSCQFSKYKDNELDEFPPLYCFDYSSNKVYKNKVTTSGAVLIATYTLDSSEAGYRYSGGYDSDNNLIVSINYAQDSSISATNNHMVISVWDLNELTENADNSFTPALISSKKVPFIEVVQGCTVYRNRLYVVSGYYPGYNFPVKVYIFDYNGICTSIIDDLPTYIKQSEGEAIAFYQNSSGNYDCFFATYSLYKITFEN